MATWQQVKSYIYSKYQVSNDSGSSITLMFETGNGRSQMVMLGHVDADEFSSLQISSPIASVSRVSGDDVLRTAGGTGVGITRIGDFYAVTHTQLLGTIDDAEIDWPIMLVTSTADRIENALGLGDAF